MRAARSLRIYAGELSHLTSLSLAASPEYRNDTRILPTLAYHVRFEYIQDICIHLPFHQTNPHQHIEYSLKCESLL